METRAQKQRIHRYDSSNSSSRSDQPTAERLNLPNPPKMHELAKCRPQNIVDICEVQNNHKRKVRAILEEDALETCALMSVRPSGLTLQ
ncbi:hypothetical protein EYF80_055077 [Liparis tanakae]|uniref:Uncharacterized protein n=1 Tax=Liparis tanakae TaxID=230148 RepID=A0A4Z2F0U1_9TELE|nr:hypothetical protein EYF80_055077 [Liparis tanakae]